PGRSRFSRRMATEPTKRRFWSHLEIRGWPRTMKRPPVKPGNAHSRFSTNCDYHWPTRSGRVWFVCGKRSPGIRYRLRCNKVTDTPPASGDHHVAGHRHREYRLHRREHTAGDLGIEPALSERGARTAHTLNKH